MWIKPLARPVQVRAGRSTNREWFQCDEANHESTTMSGVDTGRASAPFLNCRGGRSWP